MKIDQIHFYVENASWWRNWFISQMGFEAVTSPYRDKHTLIEVVKSGEAEFLLYSPESEESPVAAYLKQHPPGVAEVTFEVSYLEETLAKMQGVTLLRPLQTIPTNSGHLKWCQILGVTGLIHTLVEREGVTPLLPWLPQWQWKTTAKGGLFFTGIDHVVLNVAKGALQSTVQWYEKIFGWQRKQAFTIQTPHSGLKSQVLVDSSGKVQFPINEPTSETSQIQEFINYNRGAGIQHIALQTPNITDVTLTLKQRGVSFLRVPDTYYTQLKERFPKLPFSTSEWEQVKEAQVLVDSEASALTTDFKKNPLLLQIFTQPIFQEPTFFFELIERRDRAQGFGEGNFRALFEAIEREQFSKNQQS
ncbi:4-hydroxyphenylpyruvate dioxygenase [Euhalothece natronophila Z-M001]|uniref:4-hydroxyphenylpyruvate dioxygenase n=1 Tax=Euhalothece natronophila Z-M001 TaxID=522448 RepID=A0A5B8NP53_9CHRO|nr:4-hydroxyphenylpyruvate dioxygenase [Euhalothece natronophila]QDZ40361.1 4-hydroxyphenylpyruvate dioxygenase [Euhalothece natronophila Z-M001]